MQTTCTEPSGVSSTSDYNDLPEQRKPLMSNYQTNNDQGNSLSQESELGIVKLSTVWETI